MNIKKYTNYKYALLAIIGLLGVQTTSAIDLAANSPIQDATLKIESSHDALLNIKDSATITDAEKTEKSLTARKDIIKDALSLSMAEILNIRTGLLKLPELRKDSLEADMQVKFLAELDAYSIYYEAKAESLESLESLATAEDAKSLAKDIIDYRTNIYNPSIERMGEFLLMFYTADTVNVANLRMAKIMTDIKKLEKLNLFKPSLVNSNLDKALELLTSAADKYSQAKALIIPKIAIEETPVLEPAPENLVAEIEIQTEEGVTIEAVEPAPKPTAKELIAASLNDIKATYDIFIQISKDIRKSLGLK